MDARLVNPAGARPSCHVFVVDDDVDVRESLCELLEEEGYQAEGVANGAEALSGLRESLPSRPCVILLDLMMPIMDGYEFREEQRHDPDLARIPVVVITAHGKPREIDAAEFLPKPIRLERLLATVRRYCPQAAH